MDIFPKIAEMRAQVAAAKADQERKIREEKCRMMSATISELCEIVSSRSKVGLRKDIILPALLPLSTSPRWKKILFCFV